LLPDQVLEYFRCSLGGDVNTRGKFIRGPTDGTTVPEKNDSLEMRHAIDLLKDVLVNIYLRTWFRHERSNEWKYDSAGLR
jgi:hypothetical protein